MTDAVRIAAHAKINLFLRILAREHGGGGGAGAGGGGFHQLETPFALLELGDELVVRRTAQPGDVALTVEGPGLDEVPTADNLVVRAAQVVLSATGRKFGVAIELTKRIPVQAGLGGGSSNAAGNLVLDGGTCRYTGAANVTDRLFTVTQNGGRLQANLAAVRALYSHLEKKEEAAFVALLYSGLYDAIKAAVLTFLGK